MPFSVFCRYRRNQFQVHHFQVAFSGVQIVFEALAEGFVVVEATFVLVYQAKEHVSKDMASTN